MAVLTAAGEELPMLLIWSTYKKWSTTFLEVYLYVWKNPLRTVCAYPCVESLARQVCLNPLKQIYFPTRRAMPLALSKFSNEQVPRKKHVTLQIAMFGVAFRNLIEAALQWFWESPSFIPLESRLRSSLSKAVDITPLFFCFFFFFAWI